MEPIRVLQVVGRMDRGGIETLIMNLYRNIDRSKVQFDFLCHYGKEADYNEEILALGGKIYEMPVIKTTTKTYYHKIFSYISALNQFFREHQEYDIVHGHMTNTASLYMPIAKKYGVKYCIAHSHLTKSRKGMSGVLTNILQVPLGKIATDYFSCSEVAAKWLFSKKIIESGQVKIIKNAVDSRKYIFNEHTRIEYRKAFNIENNLVIGHVGRFYHEKNHDFLIEIFNEIHKVNNKAKLMLVGDGILRNKLEKKVRDLGIEKNVLFLGVRSDVNKLMQAMDLFIMPSHFEGLPVVGVEAQASGLKCFFSDVVTKELDITGDVKYLSLSKKASDWAQEILESVDRYQRSDTSEAIINGGYDIKKTSQMIQEFYLRKLIG